VLLSAGLTAMTSSMSAALVSGSGFGVFHPVGTQAILIIIFIDTDIS
jgi:hypothetical protein